MYSNYFKNYYKDDIVYVDMASFRRIAHTQYKLHLYTKYLWCAAAILFFFFFFDVKWPLLFIEIRALQLYVYIYMHVQYIYVCEDDTWNLHFIAIIYIWWQLYENMSAYPVCNAICKAACDICDMFSWTTLA